MAWVTCPHCGFTQIPSAACLKCRRRFDRPPPAPTAPPAAPVRVPALPRRYLIGLVGLALALVVLAILWGSRSAVPAAVVESVEVPTPAPWSLDLTGRWQGKVATTLPGPPSRPALREVFIETDRAGTVVAAGVTLTDPSHGGAGAGYLTVPNGRERLREIAAAVLASPKGASLDLDFIPLAPWAPQRDRSWRAVEGQRRNAEDTTYLLLESLETDYLIQAGVNTSGFLSYLYLSPEYASGRGTDALSQIIHPGSENTLRGFRNLVWDLSGAADFVSDQVRATVSGPKGSADRITLHRK